MLELTPPVTADALRQQYRRLAKRWQPDRHASDPAAHADATDRMRRINDAFRLVASSLGNHAPAAAAPSTTPPASRWTSPRPATARMSREETFYFVVLPPAVGRLAGLAFGFVWIPLFIIWNAESERMPAEARPWLRRLGWGLMALPLVFALLAALSWPGAELRPAAPARAGSRP